MKLKSCPSCGNRVLDAAKICKHCSYSFAANSALEKPDAKPIPQPEPTPETATTPTPSKQKSSKKWLWPALILLLVVGGSLSEHITITKFHEQTRIAPMVEAGKGRDGIYEVGDYYNVDGKEGVVFYVDDTGCHGKIVSMAQSNKELQWTSNRREQRQLIGATSSSDGAANMQVVQQHPNWRKNYPAFAWCADLGDGWYLPASDELVRILRDDSVHNAVNRTLVAKGGKELADNWYWSSTEYEYYAEFRAWGFDLYNGHPHSKDVNCYVRAVSVF